MEKMTYKNLAAFFALSVSFMVCAQATNPNQPGSAEIASTLKEGMSYADMRQTLLDAQWLPVRNPDCWENVGKQKQVCNLFAEVQSCNSDGRCDVSFANLQEQKQIKVNADGSWGTHQNQPSLTVKSWAFLAIPSAAPAVCPSEDFSQFLQAFASDEKVKAAFTSPFVKVSELIEDESGDFGSQDVYVPAAQYQGFNLRYQDNGYHFVDYQGRIDPDALTLEVTSPAVNQQLVKFQYGMSEGKSYLFENKNGCWFLTEDPQTPAP